MQSGKPSPTSTDPRIRILWPVWGHVLSTLFLLGVTAQGVPPAKVMVALLVGLVSSQASLLGIGVAAGRKRWWIRRIACFVGVGCLGRPVLRHQPEVEVATDLPAAVAPIPLHTQHYMMLQRNLLYTGVTRGKKLVVLVGTKKALGMTVRRQDTNRRFGMLRRRLEGRRW
jgi:hypothetical protein